jgi:hypothetical protein
VNERFGLSFECSTSSRRSTTSTTATTQDQAGLDLDLSDGKPKFNFLAPTGFGMDRGWIREPCELLPRMDDGTREQKRGHENASRLDADIHIEPAGWTLCALAFVAPSVIRQVNWTTTTGARCSRCGVCRTTSGYFLDKAAGQTRRLP